jgi:transposase
MSVRLLPDSNGMDKKGDSSSQLGSPSSGIPKPKLWEVPDHLWDRMAEILDAGDRQKARGRPRTDGRRNMDGILFKIRTGCQWNLIPKVYGSDTTIHRSLRRWVRLGVFEELWALLVAESPDLAPVDWRKQTMKSPRRQDRMQKPPEA